MRHNGSDSSIDLASPNPEEAISPLTPDCNKRSHRHSSDSHTRDSPSDSNHSHFQATAKAIELKLTSDSKQVDREHDREQNGVASPPYHTISTPMTTHTHMHMHSRP